MAKKLNKLGVENSLWNNIRANKGSGKAPTKEMLKQERKINAKYEEGGTTFIKDNRSIRKTTGKAINPNRDLKTKKYSREAIENLAQSAINNKLDPYTTIAQGLVETGLDARGEENIGHTLYTDPKLHRETTQYEDMVYNIKEGNKRALNKSKKSEADIIQGYNGYGKLYPSTEASFHGGKSKAFYGVPIPKNGLDMNTNPLYGKEVMDIRDNVLAKNKSFTNLVNQFQGPTAPISHPKNSFANSISEAIRKKITSGRSYKDINNTISGEGNESIVIDGFAKGGTVKENKYSKNKPTYKPKFPGKLETNQVDDTYVAPAVSDMRSAEQKKLEYKNYKDSQKLGKSIQNIAVQTALDQVNIPYTEGMKNTRRNFPIGTMINSANDVNDLSSFSNPYLGVINTSLNRIKPSVPVMGDLAVNALQEGLQRGDEEYATNDFKAKKYLKEKGIAPKNIGYIKPFAKGGKVPIKVTDPNDPRLRAYNDSNALYNFSNQERVNNIIKQGFAYDTKNNKIKNNIFSEKDKAEYQKTSGVNSKKGLQKIVQSGNNGTRDNGYNGEMDTKAQYELMHGKIAPVASANTYDKQWRKKKYLYEDELGNTLGGSELFKDEKGFRKNPNYGNPLPKDKAGKVIRNFFEIPIYKKPVQPYIYEKSKPIIEQNVLQPVVNQEPDFQPDMVQLNNNPNYDKTKLYQGYDFMQQTGLRPGDYTETQVQEAMKNKGLPKKSLGGRVLPKFYKGGVKPAGTWAGTDRSGKAIQTNFANSTAGENVETGAGIAGAAVPILTSFIPDDRITDSEGNEVGSKESMGKGILNGAAQGASMGAAAGPWGAAIGAGVGAIYGGVTNSMNNADVDRAQQQANMRIQNRNISNSVLTNKNMFSTNTSNNDQMIAAKGGTVVNEDMGNPNAELELNETFRDPMTGETGMVDGPSHDDGGIEMSLAEGTQIWSDRLKHNGRTFASLTKPIINKIANIEKGLDTNPNSRFKQNSIKLLNAQLDFFFNIQESNKQQDEMKRTLKKQEGGVVDDMGNYHYANGGIYIKPENRGKFTAYKERTGKTTEEALHSPNAHVRQMANFAKNAAGWKHAEGGYVLPKFYEAGTFNDPEIIESRPLAPLTFEIPEPKLPQVYNSTPYIQKRGNQNPYKGTDITGNKTVDSNGNIVEKPTTDQSGNTSQGYFRNNKGELMQAGALAGSAAMQLRNINNLAAPGIRPDVRLTGAIPNPKYVDLSAERGAINRAAMNAMGNRDFGNSATAQAFKNKARINQLEQAGKSYLTQENVNADIYNKFAGMRGEAGMKEAMMNNEIANSNLENRYKFNESRVGNRNAVIGDIGKGVSDIGRNRTNYSNQLEMANIYGNAREGTVQNQMLGDTESARAMFNAGTPEQKTAWNAERAKRNLPPFKYGGMIKKRSLKSNY
jgi:hypothetical protein